VLPQAAPAAPIAVVPSTAAAPAATDQSKEKYGFYIHAYANPAAVIHQVREVKKFFPGSPIYVMSDGGMDFGELCKQESCTFKLCPPANDRWHPWPFLRRIYDAAIALATTYVIMLEPDNTIHGHITRNPSHDAGGLFVPQRTFGCGDHIEKLAHQRVPGFRWTKRAMSAGLAGGAYFRREALLDAFSDENMMKIDWNYVAEKCSKEIFSSDFAMQYALAARGWNIEPWDDVVQMNQDRYKPAVGPTDAAFRHYCSCYPGGKPTYNLKLSSKDARLARSAPAHFKPDSVCQLCYNHSRYVELWGSSDCTNRLPFRFSDLLMERYHPELKRGCPDFLPWMCKPPSPR